jgi:hypothetical protein
MLRKFFVIGILAVAVASTAVLQAAYCTYTPDDQVSGVFSAAIQSWANGKQQCPAANRTLRYTANHHGTCGYNLDGCIGVSYVQTVDKATSQVADQGPSESTLWTCADQANTTIPVSGNHSVYSTNCFFPAQSPPGKTFFGKIYFMNLSGNPWKSAKTGDFTW